MTGSQSLSLNRHDLFSVLRGALLAVGGALATYFSTDVLTNLDESTMVGAVIAGIGSTLLNVLRKFLSDTQ